MTGHNAHSGLRGVTLNAPWHRVLDGAYGLVPRRVLRAPRAVWGRLRERARRSPLRLALAALLAVGGAAALGDAAYIKAKAAVAQVLLHGAWAASQAEPAGGPIRPWPHADTWPVARLEVPRLGVDQIVLAGASGRTLAFGPGHLGMSAAPGHPGNTVISGHRDTHFRFLNDLELGDQLVMATRAGEQLAYEVVDIVVAHADDVAVELVTPRRQITLVTCYPFFAIDPGTPYRYLVTAELVDDAADPAGAGESLQAARRSVETAGQPTGRTQEPESHGSTRGVFAIAAAAGRLGTVQLKGGLPSPSATPRRRAPAGQAETFSAPREKDGLTGGRLVSPLGL